MKYSILIHFVVLIVVDGVTGTKLVGNLVSGVNVQSLNSKCNHSMSLRLNESAISLKFDFFSISIDIGCALKGLLAPVFVLVASKLQLFIKDYSKFSLLEHIFAHDNCLHSINRLG